MSAIELPSRQALAAAFGRKAPVYKENARVQTLVLQELLKKMAGHDTPSPLWLDAGSGTGILSDRTSTEWTGSAKKIISVDISFDSLLFINRRHGNNSVKADIERLPFHCNALGCFVLSSVLHWTNTPEHVFAGAFDALAPDGFLAFSLFVKGSFDELYKTRAESGLPPALLLHEPPTYISMLESAGFIIESSEQFHYVDYRRSALNILHSIASVGGTAVAGKRMNRTELREFCGLYERRFRTWRGIPLTYKAVLGIARKPDHHRTIDQ